MASDNEREEHPAKSLRRSIRHGPSTSSACRLAYPQLDKHSRSLRSREAIILAGVSSYKLHQSSRELADLLGQDRALSMVPLTLESLRGAPGALRRILASFTKQELHVLDGPPQGSRFRQMEIHCL
eukprot:scaffold57_cov254-Pinguiococcus_pyrenoidosus.AAC.34